MESDIRQQYASEKIPNAVFYIPFCYYYVVRLGTPAKLLSWMLIYLMPTAFYSAVGYSGAIGMFIADYMLILLATFSLYEYGYILNDTVAIKREERPAIRLYANNFAHFERWKYVIMSVRMSCFLVPLTIIRLLNGPSKAGTVAIAIAVMFCLFIVYNCWRDKKNVWLYPLLVFSRYLPFALFFEASWLCVLLLFVSFPLLNMLERFSMPRYRYPLLRRLIPDEGSKTRFRVWYYAVLLAVATPALLLFGQSVTLLLPVAILFVYRLFLLFWVRNHQPKNYLKG